MDDLKKKTIHGSLAKLFGQTANSALRLGFIAVMARLLSPEDFGTVAMVIAVTGVYDLFTTAGLSLAAVQRPTITNEQVSSLFWVNLLVGAILGLLCVATAPVLVAFYGEPRLFWVTIAMGAGFLFNAAGVQHSAMLQREMRYVDLTAIEVMSLLLSSGLGIALAYSGFGYWALVASTIAAPAVATIAMWVATAWVPSSPRWHTDVREMLKFGGTVTINNLIVYFAYNFDKLLIGRWWGATSLGSYATAYQLVNVPTRNITGAVGAVAFAALARLQGDPARLKSYFLKGFSLLISITTPITIFSTLFADDIVLVILGPKWIEAATIFRLLSPTILVFSIINPTGWLLQSTGLHVRSLHIALAIAPLTIAAYIIGLPYGPEGVAMGFSTAMVLWLVPHVYWCLHNTGITPREFFLTILPPFAASVAAGIISGAVAYFWLDQVHVPLVRLVITGCVMVLSYASILMLGTDRRAFYLGLLKDLRGSPSSSSIPR